MSLLDRTADLPSAPRPNRRGPGSSPSAVVALFAITVRRLTKARRLIVLAVIALLPIGIILLSRATGYFQPENVESMLMLVLYPHTIVPLSALLNAPGLIQDEVEEQTLTYLLMRALPRWAIYGAKLAASIVVTSALTAACVFATEFVVWWGDPRFTELMPVHAAKLSLLFALSLSAYNALFGLIGLVVRRPLTIGVVYLFLLEFVFGNIQFVLRRLSVVYYYRDLAVRWAGLALSGPDYEVYRVETAPEAAECVWTLGIATGVLTLLACLYFSLREFRLKTPDAT